MGVWSGTQRGRSKRQRASCCCKRWSCFGKASSDSCWQIDSFLVLISTFFSFVLSCCNGFEKSRRETRLHRHSVKEQGGHTMAATSYNVQRCSPGQRHKRQLRQSAFGTNCTFLNAGNFAAELFVLGFHCVLHLFTLQLLFYAVNSAVYCCDCGCMTICACTCVCAACVW